MCFYRAEKVSLRRSSRGGPFSQASSPSFACVGSGRLVAPGRPRPKPLAPAGVARGPLGRRVCHRAAGRSARVRAERSRAGLSAGALPAPAFAAASAVCWSPGVRPLPGHAHPRVALASITVLPAGCLHGTVCFPGPQTLRLRAEHANQWQPPPLPAPPPPPPPLPLSLLPPASTCRSSSSAGMSYCPLWNA